MTDGAGWIVHEDSGVKVRLSEETVILEDHWIPRWLEMTIYGYGEPETYARVEIGSSGPRLVELRFSSVDPDARGIQQSDLRSVQVRVLVEDFVAKWMFRMERDETDEIVKFHSSFEPLERVESLHFVGRLRSGRTSRDITPQLLERVAKIYRDNISGHPNKAVEHHFQVGQRMAAEYVSRARKRGLLPPTKQGKKRA